MSGRQLEWTARYLKTVPPAVLILIFLRWETAHGALGMLRLIGDAVWQGSVWPISLLVLALGRG